MAIQLIEVLDTAVKIGLGALLVGTFAYLRERLKRKNERIKELLRLRQELIVAPVVNYIDELLVPVSEAYWSHLDRIDSDVEQKIAALRNKEATIEARVAALGDEELAISFSALTHQLFNVRAQLAERKILQANEERKRAIDLAGKVLALLFELDRLKGV